MQKQWHRLTLRQPDITGKQTLLYSRLEEFEVGYVLANLQVRGASNASAKTEKCRSLSECATLNSSHTCRHKSKTHLVASLHQVPHRSSVATAQSPSLVRPLGVSALHSSPPTLLRSCHV